MPSDSLTAHFAAADSSTAASYVDSAAAETETAAQTVVDYYKKPEA